MSMSLLDRPEVVVTLQQASFERTQSALQELVAATRSIAFFQSLSLEVHWACCRVMRLQRYAAYDVVFRLGDPGDFFCVILSGAVSVLLPDTADPTIDRVVSVLTAGQSFGELALLQNRERAATIQCREATALAVLDRRDFSRVLRRTEDSKLQTKVQVLKNVPAFARWPDNTLARFVYFFQEVTCCKGTAVYRQGDISDRVYVTISGEFRFTEDSPTNGSILLLQIGPRTLFGETEVLANTPRQSSCTCISLDGRLYTVPKDDFLRFVMKDSAHHMLRRLEHAKQRWLEQHRLHVKEAERAKKASAAAVGVKSIFQHSSLSLKLKEDLLNYSNIREKRPIRLQPSISHSTIVDPFHRHKLSLDGYPNLQKSSQFVDSLLHKRSTSDAVFNMH